KQKNPLSKLPNLNRDVATEFPGYYITESYKKVTDGDEQNAYRFLPPLFSLFYAWQNDLFPLPPSFYNFIWLHKPMNLHHESSHHIRCIKTNKQK
ncbi:hypothetical protein ACQRBL_32530, partial [Bacillus sp. AF62]